MAKVTILGVKGFKRVFKKRTSIGVYGRPKNKHQRRSFKAYRGQGRPG